MITTLIKKMLTFDYTVHEFNDYFTHTNLTNKNNMMIIFKLFGQKISAV